MAATNPQRTPSNTSGSSRAGGNHARLASFRRTADENKPSALNRSGTPRPTSTARLGAQRKSQPAATSSPNRHDNVNQNRLSRRQLCQREGRPQYLNDEPRRKRSGYANRNRGRRTSFAWHPLMLIPLALVLVLGFGAFSLISSCNQKATEEHAREDAAAEAARIEAQRVHPENLGVTVAGISTPRSAWIQGQMPHLYQTDPAWAYKPYGGGTVRANACGPTALSMVYVYLTGKTDLDPGSMAAFADAYNYAPTGATEWAFMTEGAGMLGLQSWTISVNRDSIKQALSAEQPVICSVGPGDFTNAGHYIVLNSIDSRGMVEVLDPNSAATSARRWPVQRIVNQTVNCWAFSV